MNSDFVTLAVVATLVAVVAWFAYAIKTATL